VANVGEQVHHLLLVRLAPGVTLEEATAAEAEGIDLFEAGLLIPAVGVDLLSPGQTVWPALTFTPGTYVMLCSVPDPATGLPHEQLGMMLEFTVP
jgi:hypothetical protein